MLGEQGHHAWVLEQARAYKTEYGKWPHFVSRGGQTYELVSGTNGTYAPYERNGGKGGVLSPPPTNKGAPIIRFEPSAPYQQLQEIQRQCRVEFGALQAANDLTKECSNAVTESRLETFHNEMKEKLENELKGVWKRGELPSNVEHLIRLGKGEIVERAAQFLAELEQLKARGSNKKGPVQNNGFGLSEIQRRGFHDGIESVEKLLEGVPSVSENNGHDHKMKWFGPQARDLA